jgi:hypothetical protein
MKAHVAYKQIDKWDRVAAKQNIATEWCEAVGEAVEKYLYECVLFDATPTFDGFLKHLAKIAPKEATQ